MVNRHIDVLHKLADCEAEVERLRNIANINKRKADREEEGSALLATEVERLRGELEDADAYADELNDIINKCDRKQAWAEVERLHERLTDQAEAHLRSVEWLRSENERLRAAIRQHRDAFDYSFLNCCDTYAMDKGDAVNERLWAVLDGEENPDA